MSSSKCTPQASSERSIVVVDVDEDGDAAEYEGEAELE